jgi:hypothetical protein
MKKIGCVFFCFLLLACVNDKKAETSLTVKDSPNQTITKQSKNETEVPKPNAVPDIKQAYAVTVHQLKMGNLDTVSYTYNCQGERSGKISYFSKNGKLMIISHSYNEYDHFEATDQYFVNHNQLYFAHFNRTVWKFVSEEGIATTQDDITESRIYLVDKVAALCLEKKFTIKKNAKSNRTIDDVPNKEVNCKPVNGLFQDFEALLVFKDKANKECFEKR